MFYGTIYKSFLALLWRERIEVRVVCADFALTLALSRDGFIFTRNPPGWEMGALTG